MGAGNSGVGNFGFAENVVKYATSGYIRQQCTRQVEDDEAGRKTTYTMWIEIQSRGLRAKRKDVEWADVLVAMKQAKVRKRAKGLGEVAEEIEEATYRKKGEKTK